MAMEKEINVGDGILKDTVRLVIETDGKSPEPVAVITAEQIDLAPGYRARLKPKESD